MMHRSYMRRGVSLEVIVEEDDNAEVSIDPVHYQDESDSSPSSPTLSMENDIEKFTKETTSNKYDQNCDDLDEKLRQEKQKRRKKKEEERWRNLERQRSLSCETLTVLDVGDDEFSREQWEVETRDWDTENPNTRSEIEQSISRRKILASRLEYQDKYNPDYHPETQDKYDPDYPEETRVDNEFDEVEMENGRCWNPDKAAEGIDEDSGDSEMEAIQEDKDEINDLKEEDEEEENEEEEDNSEDEKQMEKDDNENEDDQIKINPFNKFKDDNSLDDIDTELSLSSSIPMLLPSWSQEPFSNGEDSWITVGDLENEADECENEDETNQTECENEDETNQTEPTISTHNTTSNDNTKFVDEISHSPKMKQKEVRFSDQVEFVHEQGKETLQEEIKPQQIKPKRVNFSNEISINDETQPQNTNNTETHSEIHNDKLVSVKTGRHLFESKTATRVSSPLAERLTAVLETPDIMIVERTNYSQDDEETCADRNPDYDEVTSPEPTSSSSSNSAHHIELDPDELPPPNTVASVRQLFEKLPTFTLHNIRQFNLLTRYDHVRSNPTSKILRFDRHEQTNSTPIEKPRAIPQEATSQPPQSNIIKFTPEMLQNAQKKNYTPRPPEDYSSTGVHLRKPQIAHGFDVRKALRENPRYFHIRVNEKGKKEEKRISSSKNSSINSNNSNPKGKRNTVTYSYLEAKHQRHSGNTTSLRWTKESIDRSDSESMCSESSEDSGVSRDFTSSILSSFSSSTKKKKPKWRDPNLLQEEYGSDPSFKWIDPTVLAKIRARGTTVIYFGPRHRPQGTLQSRSTRRTIHENLPLFDDVLKEAPTMKDIVNNVDFDRTDGRRRNDAQYDKEDFGQNDSQTPSNIENVRPKIVGVMHKKNSRMGEMTSIVNKTCNNKNQFKPKPFLHTDSRIIHMKELKKKSAGENSIIYDFTEKQA